MNIKPGANDRINVHRMWEQAVVWCAMKAAAGANTTIDHSQGVRMTAFSATYQTTDGREICVYEPDYSKLRRIRYAE